MRDKRTPKDVCGEAIHRSDVLTTELRRTRDELDHINARFMYDMSPAYC